MNPNQAQRKSASILHFDAPTLLHGIGDVAYPNDPLAPIHENGGAALAHPGAPPAAIDAAPTASASTVRHSRFSIALFARFSEKESKAWVAAIMAMRAQPNRT